jgi:hypothetical protein
MVADVSFGERKSGYRREHSETDYVDTEQAVAVGGNGTTSENEFSEDEKEVLKSERDTQAVKAC